MSKKVVKRKSGVLLSAYICNMLETYDFIICGMLIPYTSHLYFPSDNKVLTLLLGIMTFSIGFIMRPLGGIFFGFIGDTYGRKKALLSSIFGMACATAALGLLPTYQTWGMVAPALVIALRMVQGFCLGGEGQGASVFVLEHAKGKNPGRVGSILATSNGMAGLLAFFISLYVTSSYAVEGSWRLCYLFGALVAVMGWYLRLAIDESPAFQTPRQVSHTCVPLLSIFKNRKVNFFYVFLGIGVGSALTMTGFTFVNIFLNKYLGMSPTISLSFAAVETVIGMIVVLIAGKVCDILGPYKTAKIAVLLLLLFAFPIHILLSSGQYGFIFLGLLLLAVPAGGIAGTSPHLVASSFPTSERYSGAAFGNNIAQALLGGTQPLIAVYLIEQTGSLWMPAFYIFTIGVLFFIYMSYFENSILSFSYTKVT